MIRIHQGRFKNRRLQSLEGTATRPTAAKTRQMVVNVLANRFDLSLYGLVDPFAGVGALALELFSAGGRELLLAEVNPSAAKVLQQNLASLGLLPSSDLLRGEGVSFVAQSDWSQGPWVFLLDPPYGLGLAEQVLAHLASLPLEGSILVWEHGLEEAFAAPPHWECFKTRRFGKSQIEFYEVL